MLNISALLDDSAIKHANKPAFTFMETTLTFAQINAAANPDILFVIIFSRYAVLKCSMSFL